MKKNEVQGRFFKAGAKGIELFETALGRDGSNWVLDNIVEIDPESRVEEIETLISADVIAGKAGKINHVLVTPRIFNILYLEGQITLENMAQAVENEEELSVTVYGIKFAGREYAVKTMLETALKTRYGEGARIATIDAKGEVV